MRSGDEGMIDEHGEIYVTDRIKELIKVRANQVAPSELESHLLDHPAVADVCVIGIPNEYSGELPFAFVVLIPEIRKYLRTNGNSTPIEKIRKEILKVSV